MGPPGADGKGRESVLGGGGQQLLQLLFGEVVDLVAELAGEVGGALLVDHVPQLLLAQADDGLGDPVPVAVTFIGDGGALQQLGLHAIQQPVQHVGGVGALAEDLGDGTQPAHGLLQAVDDGVVCPGQQLEHVAAGAEDGLVGVHQHTQAAGGGDLLAGGEVGGQVLGDLAAHQGHAAHVGLLEADVLDEGQKAVGAHAGAHVQLAGALQGQLHLAVLQVAPHIALGVGHGDDAPQRAVPLDAQGDGAVLLLQAGTDHGAAQKTAAQGGGGQGGELVDLAGVLHQVLSGDGDGLDGAVAGDHAYDFIHMML